MPQPETNEQFAIRMAIHALDQAKTWLGQGKLEWARDALTQTALHIAIAEQHRAAVDAA